MDPILTDDEIDAICDRVLDTNGHTCGSLIAKAIEAAVLEKLAAQEPVMQGMSEINRTIAYCAAYKLRELGFQWDETQSHWVAAPLPAVVQVPLSEDQIKRHSMLAADCPGASAVILVSSLHRLLAAAPEAPAQEKSNG